MSNFPPDYSSKCASGDSSFTCVDPYDNPENIVCGNISGVRSCATFGGLASNASLSNLGLSIDEASALNCPDGYSPQLLPANIAGVNYEKLSADSVVSVGGNKFVKLCRRKYADNIDEVANCCSQSVRVDDEPAGTQMRLYDGDSSITKIFWPSAKRSKCRKSTSCKSDLASLCIDPSNIGTTINNPTCQKYFSLSDTSINWDGLMQQYCNMPEHTASPICSCIKSAIPNPHCGDLKCIIHGYKPSNMRSGCLDASCGTYLQKPFETRKTQFDFATMESRCSLSGNGTSIYMNNIGGYGDSSLTPANVNIPNSGTSINTGLDKDKSDKINKVDNPSISARPEDHQENAKITGESINTTKLFMNTKWLGVPVFGWLLILLVVIVSVIIAMAFRNSRQKNMSYT